MLSNCPRCGKTFNKQPKSKVCRDCQEAEEIQFEQVYQYLRDNPKTIVRTVSEETGVNERLILDWFRNGRLAGHAPEVTWDCENCGNQIDRGRFCKSCADGTKSGIQGH